MKEKQIYHRENEKSEACCFFFFKDSEKLVNPLVRSKTEVRCNTNIQNEKDTHYTTRRYNKFIEYILNTIPWLN